MTRRWLVALVVVLVAVVGACGDDDADTAAEIASPTVAATSEPAEEPTPAPAPTEADVEEPTAAPDPTTTEADGPTDVRERLAAAGAPVIEVSAAEAGPHALLVWDAVDGAATYWLTLIDADGSLYWAWTGTEPSVRVGGGDLAELNQTAVLHEPMTAAVAAVDADGVLLAMSEPTTISP